MKNNSINIYGENRHLCQAWQNVWDGLFWRFMHTHRTFFLQNPRLGMLVRTFDKMSDEKKNLHLKNAEEFLLKL